MTHHYIAALLGKTLSPSTIQAMVNDLVCTDDDELSNAEQVDADILFDYLGAMVKALEREEACLTVGT